MDNYARKLVQDFPKSPYASLAQFFIAQKQVAQQEYPEAVQSLKWVQLHGSYLPFKYIAQLRMARLYLTLNQPPIAIEVLNPVPKGYEAQFYNVLGDAYAMEGQLLKSHQAYKQALAHMSDSSPLKQLVIMKMGDQPQVAVSHAKGKA